MPRVALIDNHDSFTHNVAHALREAGAECDVITSDVAMVDLLVRGYGGVVLGPGPCTPSEAGVTLPLLERALGGGSLPMLGICLGHQALAVACGGRVVRASRPMHGQTVAVRHDGSGCLAQVPSPVDVARYNSLVVEEQTLPAALAVTARSDDGAIMGLRHRELPLEGVQFHPESWLDRGARVVFATWLAGITSCAPGAGRAGCRPP